MVGGHAPMLVVTGAFRGANRTRGTAGNNSGTGVATGRTSGSITIPLRQTLRCGLERAGKRLGGWVLHQFTERHSSADDRSNTMQDLDGVQRRPTKVLEEVEGRSVRQVAGFPLHRQRWNHGQKLTNDGAPQGLVHPMWALLQHAPCTRRSANTSGAREPVQLAPIELSAGKSRESLQHMEATRWADCLWNHAPTQPILEYSSRHVPRWHFDACEQLHSACEQPTQTQ